MIGALQPLLGRNTWPPDDSIRAVWEEIEMLSGLRTSDEFTLRSLATVYGMNVENTSYVDVPVPRLISRLKANLLFAEPPDIKSDQTGDQTQLDDLVDENDLVAEMRRGALLCSSEGEVYGRLVVEPETLDWPIIEFVSRRWTIPRFSGRFLTGALFIKEIPEGPNVVWRILEDYGPGSIETRLYRGSNSQLGERRPLAARAETASLPLEQPVPTGLTDVACVFIPNTLDEDPTRGITDYLGVVRAFFAINESASVGQANVRSTGLKRLFVDGRYRNSAGNLPAGRDVFWMDSALQDALGSGGGITEAEYTFESVALKLWHDHVIDLALTFAGVAPASVGRELQGRGTAMSGTALRLRMTHTLMETAGTGRAWDRQMARLLRMAQLLDKAAFGRSWTKADAMPAFHRQDGLPRDTMEEAQETATLATAGALSLETKIRRVHPEWSDEQVQAEIARIHSDAEQSMQLTASASNPIGQQPPRAQAMLDAHRGRVPNPQADQGGKKT